MGNEADLGFLVVKNSVVGSEEYVSQDPVVERGLLEREDAPSVSHFNHVVLWRDLEVFEPYSDAYNRRSYFTFAVGREKAVEVGELNEVPQRLYKIYVD